MAHELLGSHGVRELALQGAPPIGWSRSVKVVIPTVLAGTVISVAKQVDVRETA